MPTSDDMDSFWSIDKLVPRKKSTGSTADMHDSGKKTLKPFATEIKCSEISLNSQKTQNTASGDGKLSFSHLVAFSDTHKIADREYSPKDNKFIKGVKIIHSLDRYDFYGSFRKAALLYYDYKAPQCDYVPFYSYMPQYSQMNQAQRNYYFYWRDQLNHGKYLKSDYSYICLYAFEIFNLADKIVPEDGIKKLCAVWANYRKVFPRMDQDFGVWIQDYCLIHGLCAPCALVADFIADAVTSTPIKEFWFTDFALAERAQRNLFLICLSEYDWRKGKYASNDTSAFYETHMLSAMGQVLSDIWYSGELARSLKDKTRTSYMAFKRSICTHLVKCTLDVEYYPISASGIREKITQAVRYCENKLRALMGIKSRLAIKDIDPYYVNIIDKYFALAAKREAEKRRVNSIPEYEKLYDALPENMSLSNAAQIEENSWQTTARLVSEEETAPITSRVDVKEHEGKSMGKFSLFIAQDSEIPKDEIEFLLACLAGKTYALSLENGGIVEKINERFLELIGDVVIEITDDRYAMIEDYREDIERILKHA